MEPSLNCGLLNLYRKNKEHPFAFSKDYTATQNDCIQKRIVNNELSAMFFVSVGEPQIFDLIISNTRYKHDYIKVNDEYIGCVHLPDITITQSMCAHNSFIDFQTPGSVVVIFDLNIATTQGKLPVSVSVTHSYGIKELIVLNKTDVTLNSYDPID